MGWRITKDLLFESGTIMSPSVVGHGDGADTIPEDDSVEFRLLDDDSEIYYYGRMSRDQWDEGTEEALFPPLNWARWYAGATEMQYRDGAVWKTL